MAADFLDVIGAALAERWTLLARSAAKRSVATDTTIHRPSSLVSRSPGVLEQMSNGFKYFRLALRSLLRQPTFAVIVVGTLGVAIAANVVIFSIVKRIILDPLPYDDGGRLVWISSEHAETGPTRVSAADLLDWRIASKTVPQLGAFVYWSYTYTDGEEPLDVPSMRVSPNMFEVLGAVPEIGRGFSAGDGVAGTEPVALVANEFWRAELGGDPGVVGQRLVLDGTPHTVVGVMPAGFEFPPQTDNGFWTAIAWDTEAIQGRREQRSNMVIGRLADGATMEQANDELNAIAARLGQEFPDTNGPYSVRVRSAHEVLIVGEAGSDAILILFGAVGFLLLIACTNVTNLMLARLAMRDREMSLRAALGASRGHLVRQFMSETLLLAVAGGVLGTAIASMGIEGIRSMPQLPLDRLQELRLDGGVLLFTLLLTLAIGVAFGLLPARRANRWAVAGSLKESGATAGTALGRQTLNGLVAAEVAMSLVLLIGAGLLAKTFGELMKVDLGFGRDNLLAANVFIPDTLYPEDHQKTAFFRQVVEEIESVPGVLSAAAVTSLPMEYAGIDFSLPYQVVGNPEPAGGPARAQYRVASSGYFRTMAIPLLRGRTFVDADREDSPRVMVINETLAKREFGDADPVGEFMSISIGGPHEIIGVVRDVRHYGLDTDPTPEMYIPMSQNAFGGMVLVARTAGDPTTFVQPMKEAIFTVDAQQPVYAFNTMDDLVRANVSMPRLNMILSSVFAAIALLLATIGIYGVMSYAVTQRTREIGVRMALGASARDAVRAVVGRGLTVALAGIVAGLVAAVGLTRFLQSQLFGVAAIDGLVFGGISALFVAVALAASYLPARRATRVDPLVALRHEAE
jgi:putative ABC transport system permease protein